MRYLTIAFIICLDATASAQIKLNDDGLRVRLLRSTLGLDGTAADAALVQALTVAGGNTRANVAALLAASGDAGAVASWLDAGEWPTGTGQAKRAALVSALLDSGALVDVLQATVRDLLPALPARATGLRALTGEASEPTPAQEQARAVLATQLWSVLPGALRAKVEGGAWPQSMTPAQIAALRARLAEVDLRTLVLAAP